MSWFICLLHRHDWRLQMLDWWVEPRRVHERCHRCGTHRQRLLATDPDTGLHIALGKRS